MSPVGEKELSVSGLNGAYETLDLASVVCNAFLRQRQKLVWGRLLLLYPVVVGLSRFNESVQKLKNGKVVE
jgi:hypothetical protein